MKTFSRLINRICIAVVGAFALFLIWELVAR